MIGPTSPGAPTFPSLDFSGLLDLTGGDSAFLEEFVALFDRDSRRLLAEILAAASGPGGTALERSAHAPNGMLSHLDDPMALDLCRRLEAIGSGLEAGDARDLATDLASEVALIRLGLARLAT